MKSNSRVLRGWRDFGVKATAIILTILLATQMVGTPAFATATMSNKQASEDIATTVDDTGVELSGTEATDTTVPDEAAGAANEPAPADSTQATEEPVVETVESATEPATETPAADPAANTVLGTEPEPAADSGSEPAPAVEQDQLASIKLNLADGTSITYDGKEIGDDTNPIEVPANEEFKFAAQAADGWQIDAVKTVVDGVETELVADANGEYSVAAEDVANALTVMVESGEVATADKAIQEVSGDTLGATEQPVQGIVASSVFGFDGSSEKLGASRANADWTIEVGESVQIKGCDSTALLEENKWHTWEVIEGEEHVSLANDRNQTVTIVGKSVGVAKLKHTYSTPLWESDSESITVAVNASASVSVAPQSLAVEEGSTGQLTATVSPQGREVTWSSSNDNVASVDQNGLVTGVRQGTAYITAKVGSRSATALVTITPKPTYRIVYSSNYPEDALKFNYSNGSGSIEMVDAENTNAAYQYEPGTTATVIEGMTCANYTFLGWSTDPDAVTGDAAFAPGEAIVVDGNLTLYAVWGNRVDYAGPETIVVHYQYRNENFYRDVEAPYYFDGGNKIYAVVLANNQDTFAKGDNSFRGWTHNEEHYSFNATLVTGDYDYKKVEYSNKEQGISINGNYNVIDVTAWLDDSGETYAQFFVLKRDPNPAAGTNAENYYSVGTGTINTDLIDQYPYPNGEENSDNDVSSVITSAPDAVSISNILSISLSETENIRWYVIKDQDDGYHVDGIIYDMSKFWNVRFIDQGVTAGDYIVQDGSSLPDNLNSNAKRTGFCKLDLSGWH